MTRYIHPKTFIKDEETIKILEENLDTRIRNRGMIPKNTPLYTNNEKMIIALVKILQPIKKMEKIY